MLKNYTSLRDQMLFPFRYATRVKSVVRTATTQGSFQNTVNILSWWQSVLQFATHLIRSPRRFADIKVVFEESVQTVISKILND